MPVYQDPDDPRALNADALQSWTAAVLQYLGTPADIAADVAEILLASDRRGIASHGTARLPQYVSLVDAGVVDPAARPVLEKDLPALGRFDAQNGWGHHASRVAIDTAIDRARTNGAWTAVVRRSNHYGIAGWYALRAAEAGMIGMSLTNSSPLVAPTRARIAMVGTNPIAIAAPAGRFGSLCLDMATSTVPRGRIEVAARRGEALPVGWAIDVDGHPATTPDAALGGALQPLGGGEETAGYKGYGLALIVDLLTGVLGGAAFGPNIIPLFSTHDGIADLGQLFWVIDPAALDDAAFEGRLETYCEQLTSAPLIPDAPGRVLIPGEPEAAAERRSAARGIVIDREHHEKLGAIADRFGVPLPDATTPAPWSGGEGQPA
jgi:LDH2 family malate/lactate/ureidoglycolate dehydrogenase